jgi:transcriptional regulator with XRE-family HTH domain
MLANISTKNPYPVDRKYRRFIHDLDYAYMNILVDSKESSQRLGRALRALRLARNWTLNDFERASEGQIKAVVLGSYERGSRSISVLKLETIAAIYDVPISGILKDSNDLPILGFRNVIIDLRKLRDVLKSNPSKNLVNLNLFTSGIVDFRRDWNGEILSLRNSDLNYLAILANSNPEKILEEYSAEKVLFKTRD